MKKIIGTLILAALLFSCKSGKNISQKNNDMSVSAVEQTIIYKTIRDFSQLVPVIMNDDRTQIVSYPAPTDLLYKGKPALPVQLINGYLLDNRGIGTNVAFMSFTYAEYAALKEVPSMEVLLSKIVEKYPLAEMYFCGRRDSYKNLDDLNKLIENGFPDCRKAEIRVMQITL
jgi:hypothetical protein